MKALWPSPAWAWLVATWPEALRTRSWSTTYRGPLAINATKSRKYLGPGGR